MNLDELQAMLDTVGNATQRQSARAVGVTASVASPVVPSVVTSAAASVARTQSTVRLVPKPAPGDLSESVGVSAPLSLHERMQEIEMAQKLGYLLCRCSWPPQIMVLTGADHVYRCRRCSRVREM